MCRIVSSGLLVFLSAVLGYSASAPVPATTSASSPAATSPATRAAPGIQALREAAAHGDADAMYRLALVLQAGVDEKIDLDAALKLLENACRKKHVQALLRVGDMYRAGDYGVAADLTSARQYYGATAGAGNLYARVALGQCYEWRGSSELARRCFTGAIQRAREQNTALNDDAALTLGLVYLEGKTVEVDLDAAADHLQTAYGLGNPQAAFWLTELYARAPGRDPKDTLTLWRKLADRGDALVMKALGAEYLRGKAVPRDPAQALKWLSAAAERKCSAAMPLLGELYEQGLGVQADPAAAQTWYQRGAHLHNPAAMFCLARGYLHGTFGKPDVDLAMMWYGAAARSGQYTPAMIALGRICEEGVAGKKDPTNACYWYRAASNRGDPEGKCELGRCFEEGFGASKDPQKSFACYQDAAALHYPRGMFQLARAYADGIGTEKNEMQARYWAGKAAQLGDPEAQKWLTAHPAAPSATSPAEVAL